MPERVEAEVNDPRRIVAYTRLEPLGDADGGANRTAAGKVLELTPQGGYLRAYDRDNDVTGPEGSLALCEVGE